VKAALLGRSSFASFVTRSLSPVPCHSFLVTRSLPLVPCHSFLVTRSLSLVDRLDTPGGGDLNRWIGVTNEIGEHRR
jgi:hypothetical protein